jgi:hypothetical protein
MILLEENIVSLDFSTSRKKETVSFYSEIFLFLRVKRLKVILLLK